VLVLFVPRTLKPPSFVGLAIGKVKALRAAYLRHRPKDRVSLMRRLETALAILVLRLNLELSARPNPLQPAQALGAKVVVVGDDVVTSFNLRDTG
jgi:hypothetical protein